MDDTTVLVEELRGFGLRAADDTILRKILELGVRWNLDEVVLVEKYVAFQRNAKLPDEISMKNVDLFSRELTSRFESLKNKMNKSNTSAKTNTTTPVSSKNILPQKMLEELMATESHNEQQDLFSSYIPSVNISQKTPLSDSTIMNISNIRTLEKQSNSVKEEFVCTYTPDTLSERPTTSDRVPSNHWTITQVGSPALVTPLRYMHQPTVEKAEVLDNWTWNKVKSILNAVPEQQLSVSSIGDESQLTVSQPVSSSLSNLLPKPPNSQPNPSSNVSMGLERTTLLRPTSARLQSTSLVAGRIATVSSLLSALQDVSNNRDESSDTIKAFCKQRIQLSSVGLIGLRRLEHHDIGMDGITSVELCSTGLSTPCSFYTGQPVVLRATNPTGQRLIVKDVLPTPFPAPPPIESTKSDLELMICCGPYTLSDSNDPSLLLSLLRTVKKHRPHVLVLLGPFVDSNHPATQNYSESTFDELFQNRLNSIAEYCSHLDVQVVVVSSWREMHHDPVYPTPPLDRTWTQKTPELTSWYNSVHFVLDPCLLQIGAYVFGVTTVDVLFEMSSEEVNVGCSGDRIARLCRHILSSGSFYPIHPPSDDIPLDYPQWDQNAHFSVTPHCLILPSRLRQFVKNVDGIMCLNPGYVSRGQSTGSCACVTIHNSDAGSEGESVATSIYTRMSVSVLRI